jgi:ribonuclease P protein component
VTVTKRVANAVGRNRVRRLVREVFRRNRAFFPANCVLVWVARSGADKLDYATVRGELVKSNAALQRAAAPDRSRTSSNEAR